MIGNSSASMVAETKKFLNVLNSYYSVESRRIYDFLLFFYFAKKGTLRYVENILPEDKYDMVLASEDDELNQQLWDNLTAIPTGLKELLTVMDDEVTVKKILIRMQRIENKHFLVLNRAIVADFKDSDDREEIEDIISLLESEYSYMQDADCYDMQDADCYDSPVTYNSSFTALKAIVEELTTLSEDWYNSNVDFAFNETLRKIQAQRRTPENFHPGSYELAKFVAKLLDIKQGTVYDPFTGVGFFDSQLGKSVDYTGTLTRMDIKPVTRLNLLLHSKNSKGIDYGYAPQIRWNKRNYDNIVMLPVITRNTEEPIETYTTYETDSYDEEPKNMLAIAAEDCKQKSVSVHLVSTCFSSEGISLLKPLIESDLLETVILLPNNISGMTNAQSLVLVTNKSKQKKGVVRFVDASQCVEETVFHDTRFDIDGAVSLCLCGNDGNHVIDVPTREITGNGYMVYPLFYLNTLSECEPGKRMVELSKCLEPSAVEYSCDKEGLFFTFNEKDRNAGEYTVKAGELPFKKLTGAQMRVVRESCLLWTKFTKQFAYLETKGDPVFIKSDFKVFKVNEDVVNPQYLLSELYEDYFIKQLDRFGKNAFGSHGVFMSTDDFLSCKIQLPKSRLEQEKSVLSKRSALLDERKGSLEDAFQRKFEDFVLCQRQRKHQVAQVLNEIMPTVEVICDFVESNEAVTKDTIVSKRSGKSFGEYLSSLSQLVLKMSHMVDKFTADEKFSPCEDFNLNEFLPKYVEGKNTNETFRISFTPSPEDIDDFYDIEGGADKQLSMFKVGVSREDLTVMLDNLVDNAKKYGFTNDEWQNHEIVISLERHDKRMPGMACISVCNDGGLVSESMDLKKLFAWGEGHGSGIGCWQVKNIAEHFGGTVTYEEYENSPYPCVFNIYLPLIED